jgi:hypothetical protein
VNIGQLRLINQRLVDAPFKTPVEVVRWFGAMQAQDYPGAKWGIGLRMRTATDAAVQAAFDSGAILRTHALRPTWHFIAAADLRWMLALTSPRVQGANARVYQQLELDDGMLRRACKVIRKTLERTHLTRAELGEALNANRISVTGQRLAHVVMKAELDGLICSGPVRGKQHTYALLDERITETKKLSGDEALCELARIYFRSHGPATANDFSWWSSFTVAECKRAVQMLGNEVESAVVDGKTYWFANEALRIDVKLPVVHLLPNYDEHVVAYRDHGPSLDPRAPTALAGWGNGLTTHMIVLNGLVIGGWRRNLEKDHIRMRMHLHVSLKARERTALKRAIVAYASFMKLPVEVA